eukprot:223922-Hanusia_phi.AAC.4
MGARMRAGMLLLAGIALLLCSLLPCHAKFSKEDFEHGFRQQGDGSLVAKNLPGRPLMIHNPHTLLLHHTADRAHAKLKTRFREDPVVLQRQAELEKSSKSHYLVRVKYPAPPDMLSQLKVASGDNSVQYIPYDTFVVAMESVRKDRVARLKGVETIFHLPASMKISNSLQDYVTLTMKSLSAKQPDTIINNNPQHPEKRGTLDNSHKKTSAQGRNKKSEPKEDKYSHHKAKEAPSGPDESVFLEAAISVHPDHMSLSKFLQTLDQAFSTSSGKIAQVWAKSSNKLTIETNAQNVGKVVEHLANQASVKWMEKRAEFHTMNKYSSLIVQGVYDWQPVKTKLESLGLNGTGQRVGIADTGIDFDSCFFYDPNIQVFVCEDCYFYGYSCSSMCPAQADHRKIVSYNSFPPPPPFPQSYDLYHGHGTHVSGIVAGAAGPNHTLATQYNGSAPGAKIVFDDISNVPYNLNYLPWDLNADLFPHAYDNGARVHSDSWGSSSNGYDFNCMEADNFMYEHDDFLVVFAAGNNGPYHFSVGSPGNAKNVLSVGSSLNSRESYIAHGYGLYYNLSVLFSDGSMERELLADILPASFGAPLTPSTPVINASLLGQNFNYWCPPNDPYCIDMQSLLCLPFPDSNLSCTQQTSGQAQISSSWSSDYKVENLNSIQSSVQSLDYQSCYNYPWMWSTTCTVSINVSKASGRDVELVIQVPLLYNNGIAFVSNVQQITVAGDFVPVDFSSFESQFCGQVVSLTYKMPSQVSGIVDIVVEYGPINYYYCGWNDVTFTTFSHATTSWNVLYDSSVSQMYNYYYNYYYWGYSPMISALDTGFDLCVFGENVRNRTFLTGNSLVFGNQMSTFTFNTEYESYPLFVAGKSILDNSVKGFTIYMKQYYMENSCNQELEITLYENNSIAYTVISPVSTSDAFSFTIKTMFEIFSGMVPMNQTVTLTGFSNPMIDYFRDAFKGSVVASPFIGYCDAVLMAWNAQQMGASALLVYEPSRELPPPLLRGSGGPNDRFKDQVTIAVAGISGLDAYRLFSMTTMSGCAPGPWWFCMYSIKEAKLPVVSNVRSGQEYKHTDLSFFSSRGPTFDLRNKPDIVAPGQNIFSASSDGVRNSYQCANSIGLNKSCILEMSGTSMATPATAGAAAIVRQYFEQGYHVTGSRSDSDAVNPSSALVKAMLIQSGKPLRNLVVEGSKLVKNGLWGYVMLFQGSEMTWQESTQSPSPEQGYGLVDLSSVLWFGTDSNFVLKTFDRVQLSQGQVMQYCFSVSGGSQFRATLVWTDPPGSMYASKALISDLDLVLIDADGSSHYGNNRTALHADRVNNVEQITVADAPAGTYSVYVSAYDLPQGSQNFSLVVTGAITAETGCSSFSCPNNCSGHGTCRTLICDCDAGYYSIDCSLRYRCGDGIVTAPEECDDGNSVSGDGCSSTCQVEQGWECDQEIWPQDISSCYKCSCGCERFHQDSGLVNGTSPVYGSMYYGYPYYYYYWGPQCVYDIEPKGLTSMQVSFPDMQSNPYLQLEIYTCATSDCSQWNYNGGISGTYMNLWLPNAQMYNAAFRANVSKLRVVSYSPFLLRYGPVVYDVCGDGIQEGLEACDDGNLIDGDGCSSTCKRECTVASCCSFRLSTRDMFAKRYEREVAPGATCASFEITDGSNGENEVELAVIPIDMNQTVCAPPELIDSASSAALKFNGSSTASQYSPVTGTIGGTWNLLFPASLSSGNQNMDDGFWLLPDFGFDFCVEGKNVRNRTYVSSNSYITFYNGFSYYSGLSPSWPPTPTLFIGGEDTSAQLVLTKKISESGLLGLLVRFEGTASTSGILGSPNIIWEVTFFQDNTVRVSLGRLANLNGISMLSDGRGKIMLSLFFQPNTAELLQLRNLCVTKVQPPCDRLDLISAGLSQVLPNEYKVFRGRSLTLNFFSTVSNRLSAFPFQLSWGGKSKPLCGNGLRDWTFRMLTSVNCTSTTMNQYMSTVNSGMGYYYYYYYYTSTCKVPLQPLINSTGPKYLLVDMDSTSLYGSGFITNVTLNGRGIPFTSPNVMTPMCGSKSSIVLSEIPPDVEASSYSLVINVSNPNCWYCASAPMCYYINAEAFLAALDEMEQCDDGNQVDGDGCSSTCTIEPGATCGSTLSVGGLQAGPDVCHGRFTGAASLGGCSGWLAWLQSSGYLMPTLNASSYPFLWGENPSFRNCSLPYSWEEIVVPALKNCSVQYKMGGLGLEMTDQFQVWICVKNHPCALSASDPYFCFVYDELNQKFVPWGANSDLHLFAAV